MKQKTSQTETKTDLIRHLIESWSGLIQLTLSQPRGTSGPTKVSARMIQMKDGQRVQFTFFDEAQQTHANFTFDAALDECLKLLASRFSRLHLFTITADIVVQRNADGSYSRRQSAPTKVSQELSHDRRKQYLIPEDQPCSFLIEIGVMNATGKVFSAKYHKFRQINRFLELVKDVLPNLPTNRELQVVDFGSGKSYLTFALHHLLTNIQGLSARIIGVDRKRDVIDDCRRIAKNLDCQGLSFEAGNIEEFGSVGQVDLMVALHACDTATDAALAQAVRWQTPVIMAVPCCQHEMAANAHLNPALAAIDAHGILKERFAALATDALRANVLELCGYQTQVLEFIEMEHTAKNLLIRATRRSQSLTTKSPLINRHQQLIQLMGIRDFHLDRALADLLPAALSSESIQRC